VPLQEAQVRRRVGRQLKANDPQSKSNFNQIAKNNNKNNNNIFACYGARKKERKEKKDTTGCNF
jgi:hypothetical protein